MNINMNISTTSFNEMTESVNLRQRSESNVNREVPKDTPAKTELKDQAMRARELELKKKIQDDVTMDVSEVKNFLFMLIGAEVRVKPENSESGSFVNRIA